MYLMIAALVTSHNRREHTIRCIRSVRRAANFAGVELDVILVDDLSEDGTADLVASLFPEVRLLSGTGELFWAGGMRRAEEVALRSGAHMILWLNDDVELFEDGLETLLEVAQSSGPDALIAGALRDPDTGFVTYSGLRRVGRHPLHLELIDPQVHTDELLEPDAFNGNVVLMSATVPMLVGGIDDKLVHRAADIDFAFRARAIGLSCRLASRFVGNCRRDQVGAPWFDRSLSRRQRIAQLCSPKGVPPRASARFLRRHGGIAWPVFWLSPYVRFFASLVPLIGDLVPPPDIGPRRPLRTTAIAGASVGEELRG